MSCNDAALMVGFWSTFLQDELSRVLLLHRTRPLRNLQSFGWSRILRALSNIQDNFGHYSLPTGSYHELPEFRADPSNLFLLRSILILFCHHELDKQVIISFVWDISLSVWYTQRTNISLNPLTPNDPYMGRTPPLTSKFCILYIYSTIIGTEYFKHGIYIPVFFLFKMQFVSQF